MTSFETSNSNIIDNQLKEVCFLDQEEQYSTTFYISSVQFWWDIYVTENIGKQLYTEKRNQFNSL